MEQGLSPLCKVRSSPTQASKLVTAEDLWKRLFPFLALLKAILSAGFVADEAGLSTKPSSQTPTSTANHLFLVMGLNANLLGKLRQ